MPAFTALEEDIVIAFCGSAKKHRQSFDKLRQYVEDKQTAGGWAGPNHMRFSFVDMHYEPSRDEMVLDTGDDADVVLQKVSTLPPKSAPALKRWCAATSHRRIQQGRAPVLLIDPVDNTELVLSRFYLLDKLCDHMCSSLCATPAARLCMLHEGAELPSRLPLLREDNCDDPLKVKWWILKANLSTGPAYTHHMVVWRGATPLNNPPEHVCRLVPAEVDKCIVQEFYADALPVVVKVYGIGGRIWAKAVPTGNMMRHIRDTVACNRDTGVFVDPQQFAREAVIDAKEAAHWEQFLGEGGQAHERVARIAQELVKVLSLSLFGFDVLLLPPGSGGSNTTCFVPGNMDDNADTSTRLFDDNGVPTPWLCKSTPVIIDVNYFPGYGGTPGVNANLIQLIEERIAVELSINRS